MEREMASHAAEFKLIEESHGKNTLNLAVVVGYLRKLAENTRVARYLIAVELVAIVLIDYTAPGHLLLGTGPVPGSVWLFVVPFALGMVLLEELRKWFVRRR